MKFSQMNDERAGEFTEVLSDMEDDIERVQHDHIDLATFLQAILVYAGEVQSLIDRARMGSAS